jgi:hypothetical protein
MEAEYVTLSTAMRYAFVIKMFESEISENVGLTKHPMTRCQTPVWEDNAGALKLATLKPGRMNARSQWYGIKYHWFRVKLKPNCIGIIKIESADQRADFLMKSLRRDKFEANQKLPLGW